MDKVAAVEGDTVTITPLDTLATLTVTDEDSEEVVVTQDSSVYTFEMPASDVVIAATAAEEPVEPNSFSGTVDGDSGYPNNIDIYLGSDEPINIGPDDDVDSSNMAYTCAAAMFANDMCSFGGGGTWTKDNETIVTVSEYVFDDHTQDTISVTYSIYDEIGEGENSVALFTMTKEADAVSGNDVYTITPAEGNSDIFGTYNIVPVAPPEPEPDPNSISMTTDDQTGDMEQIEIILYSNDSFDVHDGDEGFTAADKLFTETLDSSGYDWTYEANPITVSKSTIDDDVTGDTISVVYTIYDNTDPNDVVETQILQITPEYDENDGTTVVNYTIACADAQLGAYDIVPKQQPGQ